MDGTTSTIKNSGGNTMAGRTRKEQLVWELQYTWVLLKEYKQHEHSHLDEYTLDKIEETKDAINAMLIALSEEE